MEPDMSLKAAAVLYAKDIKRVSTFYAEVAELTIVHSEADHVILESASFQLTVVAIPNKFAASIEIASPPIRRENTAIKLVFFISNIASTRAIAARLGGELNPVDREWEFLDCRVCDGHDPEGNVIQLRQVG
jgi:predicted enzyme related to lactoylglutathione lyase